MNQLGKQLKVIELATVLAGPSVGMFFAELGATVIKVENPNNPDVTRSWKLPNEKGAISAYFSSVNYGKDFIQLDLTDQQDCAELDTLLADTDILLTNFKYGGAAKFNLDFERLHHQFPKLIIGQISGFKSNPKRTAFDVVVQAETGWMHMNGTPDSGPVKMPVALMDVLAAHHLKEGLLLALLERSSTGRGKFVEVTLEEAGIASLANQASNYLMANHIPKPIGSQHPNIAPYGDTFTCADGKALVLAVGNNRQFNKLISILQADENRAIADFSTNQKRVQKRGELVDFLAPYFNQFSRDELLHQLIEEGVPAGAIRPLNEVFENPIAKKMVLHETINGEETSRVKTVLF
jgi:crotonobetainyl-CoA:carnitine CoA-transferase CaiB-like acyl-CoA transferase